MSYNVSCLSASMRGVVYDGMPFDMQVRDIPRPVVLNENEVVVRVTTAAICGSDLHVYRGYMGGNPPWGMGHEAIGYVSQLGEAVSSFAVGDYVVIPDTVSAGHVDMEPRASDYFGFGNSAIGLGGLQSEYARVPYADTNLIPLPLTHETTNLTVEQDYLMVSDIFATAWAGVEYSGFESGDTIAVFGGGPVGLLVAYSAILRGASKVFVVDHVGQRLALAASIGAVPIDFAESDAVAQILAYEPNGVMRSVDCVGMEAVNSRLQMQSDIVMRQMVEVAHYGGGLGLLGVYKSQPSSSGAPYGDAMSADIGFPISTFFSKALTLRGGAVDPKVYAPVLIDLISRGKARPSFVVSAVVGIEDAAEYYKRFHHQQETKVIIHFPQQGYQEDCSTP
ncbi:hypothetical protein K4K59_011947 [Colletotrichum sp. SAR11_240]|nr:hypothetical protein K4K59_011947 [Colletotrichum sp. SAR11_240]